MKIKKIKISYNAPVVLIFVALCFMATTINSITKGVANQYFFMTYHSPLTSFMTYIRFFTHVIGHANWDHFIGNMCYILLLGPMLEEKYGSKGLLIVMAVTAVVTGGVNYIFFPNVALCGASGIVFAFILLSSFTSFKEGEIPLTFILVMIFFLGQQILQGMFVADQISNMAHIVGGIVGSFFGYLLNKKEK